MQSSYKKFHSTETSLNLVLDDMLCAIDTKKLGLLIMQDLSAAFDTVDHKILLSRMETRLGICGNALKWFESYLSGRSQCVYINENQSNPITKIDGKLPGLYRKCIKKEVDVHILCFVQCI